VQVAPGAGGGAAIMNPKLRLWLFILAGAGLGIAIGVDIADESYGVATLLALLSAAMVLSKATDAPADAWLLAGVLLGYIVGNRGFAQLQPAPTIPLLPAEAVLLVAVPALIARAAMKRATAVRRDALNYSLIAWILLGSIRLPLDLRDFGVIALRDFAMVYYAVFFFVGQALGDHAGSARVLKRALTAAFLLLMPVVVSIQIAPDFLVDNFTLRGIPIIYHKSDLIATSLAAGTFWLWTRWEKSHNRLWLVASGSSLLLIGLMASPRAAMFAIGVTTLLWLCTGRWRLAAAQVGMIAAASLATVVALSLEGGDLRTSVPYSMYEHAISIFDPAGSGSYINGESGNPGDNNRFRMVWWRDVIEDTASQAPVLGLGFGADLSTRFLADYDLLSDENFAARSPHSMIVTVIGRMGFVGLAAWLAASAGMALMVWRLLKLGSPDGMGLASIVAVVWLSACFGVVLEGPMGAVIFWPVAGLANSLLRQETAARVADAADEWPVAKTAALGTQSGPR
jgi:hypothetical protein